MRVVKAHASFYLAKGSIETKERSTHKEQMELVGPATEPSVIHCTNMKILQKVPEMWLPRSSLTSGR